MNKRAALALVTLLSLLLPGCAPAGTGGTDGEEARLTVLASTYPVYLAARSVAEGVEGVSVLRLETGAVSCLHDYTLTVGDMKKLEGADVVALNGAGMEEFMEDALASSSAPVIDCSEGVDLLEGEGHVHQDGEEDDDHGHFDPHYWMDPENMEQMVYNIRDGLSQADPEHAGEYEENAAEQAGLLHTWDDALQDMIQEAEENAGVEISGLITFHDGFRYFAEAFDLPLLASIEEGVSVLRLETGAVSCLHDYTLTVGDMKKLEGADVVALNGAGMEEFMEDALASSSAPVIDCSEGVDLLEGEGHVHQDGEEDDDHGHFDPHYWMDPENMEQMVYNIRDGLSQADPEHAGEYEENAAEQAGLLHTWDDALQDMIQEAEENAGVEISGLITFHDGFRYFAEAFDLPLLASIEEEEGSEASAKEINEIAGLVKEYSLPVIFTEVNGSDATAQAIARETGCAVAQLSMCMDGPEEGTLSDYYTVLADNVTAVVNGFAGEEVIR